jgi:hypothetical protein
MYEVEEHTIGITLVMNFIEIYCLLQMLKRVQTGSAFGLLILVF